MASFCSHKKPRKYFKPSQVKSPVASWLNAELMSAELGKWKMWKAFGNKGSDLTVKRLTIAVFPPGDLQSLPNILRRQQRWWTRKKLWNFCYASVDIFPPQRFIVVLSRRFLFSCKSPAGRRTHESFTCTFLGWGLLFSWRWKSNLGDFVSYAVIQCHLDTSHLEIQEILNLWNQMPQVGPKLPK